MSNAPRAGQNLKPMPLPRAWLGVSDEDDLATEL